SHYYCYTDFNHANLHAVPTRRSSDLKAAGKNPAVRGICFSRNFGKEAAMFAGMYYAKGACCVVIDCDLQHPPEKILEMYRLWEQDRKSTRLNSSHVSNSYAVFCLKNK